MAHGPEPDGAADEESLIDEIERPSERARAPVEGVIELARPVEGNLVRRAYEDRVRGLLARRLFWAFLIAILISPLLYLLSAVILFAPGPNTADVSQRLLDAAERVDTTAITAVTGVFGAVIGFYFGSISRDE